MTKTQRIIYLSNCCHVCKSTDAEVPCEICHMITYCCVNHRKDHWQAHSHLCRALYKVRSKKGLSHVYEKAIGTSVQNFRDLRHSTAQECSQLLGRPLESWEFEMIYYPKICNVCFNVDHNELNSCQDCGFIHTCLINHFNKNHSRWCSTLKTYVDIVRQLHFDGAPFVPDFRLSMVPSSMQHCISIAKENIPLDGISSAFLSELLTYPLTLCNALLNLPSKKTTVVHIIGAELDSEVMPISKWETYLLHLLPHSSSIKLVFIGPDLFGSDLIPIKSEIKVCQNCRDCKKCVSYELVPGTMYHDYAKRSSFSKADLITAFNSGLYRSQGVQGFDSWGPTLELLFASGSAPVLVSEYTSLEIEQDLKILEKRFSNFKVTCKPENNALASLKPNLNVISDDDTPVIFKNYYCMTVSG